MIQRSTLSFLTQLKKNNNKPWFDKNRPVYEEAKADFKSFIEQLLKNIQAFDPSMKGIEAKNCIFRINRDIRFSNDKSPYKSHFGAHMSPGGRKSHQPGYYIHLEPGGAFLAGGMWEPEGPQLAAIRQEIDYNTKDFKKLLSDKNFKKYFGTLDDSDKLKTAPKGYPKDHPELSLLQHKSFIMVNKVDAKTLASKDLLKHCTVAFKAMYPMDVFLRRAIEA